MFSELGKVLNSTDPQFTPGAGFTTIDSLAFLIANAIILVAIGLSSVAIAFSFIQMMMAQGDPKVTEKSVRAVLWSCAAFGISLLAWTLKNVVFRTIGI